MNGCIHFPIAPFAYKLLDREICDIHIHLITQINDVFSVETIKG